MVFGEACCWHVLCVLTECNQLFFGCTLFGFAVHNKLGLKRNHICPGACFHVETALPQQKPIDRGKVAIHCMDQQKKSTSVNYYSSSSCILVLLLFFLNILSTVTLTEKVLEIYGVLQTLQLFWEYLNWSIPTQSCSEWKYFISEVQITSLLFTGCFFLMLAFFRLEKLPI